MIPTRAQFAHIGGWIVIGGAGLAISVVAFTPLFWPEPRQQITDDFADALEAELSASPAVADGARHTSARPVNAGDA